MMSKLPPQFALLALVIAATESFLPLQAPSFCPADSEEPWTYRGEKGPQNWGEMFEQCNGTQQSPIDIQTSGVAKDENLEQLNFENYGQPLEKATLENNGHSVEVRPADDVTRTISVKGDEYRLHQFHFHWGRFFFEGSEHTVDRRRYAMEMHLVHMNDAGDISVVGIFLQEQIKPNKALQPIVNQLSKLRYKGAGAELEEPLELGRLLPANNGSFYRYDGSLTTPECDEGVTWSVLTDPIPVGTGQMREFRRLRSATEGNSNFFCGLSGNYRPVQPLNDRRVIMPQ